MEISQSKRHSAATFFFFLLSFLCNVQDFFRGLQDGSFQVGPKRFRTGVRGSVLIFQLRLDVRLESLRQWRWYSSSLPHQVTNTPLFTPPYGGPTNPAYPPGYSEAYYMGNPNPPVDPFQKAASGY
ncbi:hypothetical protein ACOMHN_005541 [Nucella lapillus]